MASNSGKRHGTALSACCVKAPTANDSTVTAQAIAVAPPYLPTFSCSLVGSHRATHLILPDLLCSNAGIRKCKRRAPRGPRLALSKNARSLAVLWPCCHDHLAWLITLFVNGYSQVWRWTPTFFNYGHKRASENSCENSYQGI